MGWGDLDSQNPQFPAMPQITLDRVSFYYEIFYIIQAQIFANEATDEPILLSVLSIASNWRTNVMYSIQSAAGICDRDGFCSRATQNLYRVGKIYIASALLYCRGLCACFSGQAWR